MAPTASVRIAAVALLLVACESAAPAPDAAPPPPDGGRGIVVVTYNTGTTLGLRHDDPPDDGYTSAMAATSDALYGDGLAWPPAIAAARAFFDLHRPDLVAFRGDLRSRRLRGDPGRGSRRLRVRGLVAG